MQQHGCKPPLKSKEDEEEAIAFCEFFVSACVSLCGVLCLCDSCLLICLFIHVPFCLSVSTLCLFIFDSAFLFLPVPF